MTYKRLCPFVVAYKSCWIINGSLYWPFKLIYCFNKKNFSRKFPISSSFSGLFCFYSNNFSYRAWVPLIRSINSFYSTPSNAKLFLTLCMAHFLSLACPLKDLLASLMESFTFIFWIWIKKKWFLSVLIFMLLLNWMRIFGKERLWGNMNFKCWSCLRSLRNLINGSSESNYWNLQTEKI